MLRVWAGVWLIMEGGIVGSMMSCFHRISNQQPPSLFSPFKNLVQDPLPMGDATHI